MTSQTNPSDTNPYVHDHPVRGRLNAAFFTALGGCFERLLREEKSAVLGGLGRTVVEIGPGVGANLRHYAPTTTVHAIEPNRRMHPGLRRRARRAGVDLRLHETGAEAIDLPDASVDDAVSTLVLCTVAEPARAIAEVARVLRPGGRFRFVEHVAAAPGSLVQRVQDVVARPWRWAFEGCHVDRRTHRLVEAGPFREVRYAHYRMRSPFVPANPGVAGIAVR